MSDYNVTFAGLPMESPIIIEVTSDQLDVAVANQCRQAGAGGVLFPLLDEDRLNRIVDDTELTEHNRDDRGKRDSARILRRLNAEEYLKQLEETVAAVDAPVIGALQCSRRDQWFALAQQMKEAGARAVEIRPFQTDTHRGLRSDNIEKAILRTTAYVADRLEIPLIVRIPGLMHGAQAFVQALGEAGAAGVLIEPPDVIHGIDIEAMELTDAPEDRNAAYSAFLTALSACRGLYRRVPSHLALQVPDSAASSLIMAVLAGASLVTIPVDGTNTEESPELVKRYMVYLKKWMTSHSMASLFDFRGVVSESRLQSSLEN